MSKEPESWFDHLAVDKDATVLRDDFGRVIVLNDWGVTLTFSTGRVEIPAHKALTLAQAIEERYGDKAPQ